MRPCVALLRLVCRLARLLSNPVLRHPVPCADSCATTVCKPSDFLGDAVAGDEISLVLPCAALVRLLCGPDDALVRPCAAILRPFCGPCAAPPQTKRDCVIELNDDDDGDDDEHEKYDRHRHDYDGGDDDDEKR